MYHDFDPIISHHFHLVTEYQFIFILKSKEKKNLIKGAVNIIDLFTYIQT